MIYLDSAATSLLKPISVGRAVSSAIISCSSPGRGGYAPAMSAAQLLYECRCAAASLFDVPEPAAPESAPSPVEREILEADLSLMTPIEALNMLYRLQETVQTEKNSRKEQK